MSSSPYKIDPFQMEPIRANVLQLPQILKEVSSLEASIRTIKEHLAQSEASLKQSAAAKAQELQKAQEFNLSNETVDVGQENTRDKTTSQVYSTPAPLPKRFEEPCKLSWLTSKLRGHIASKRNIPCTPPPRISMDIINPQCMTCPSSFVVNLLNSAKYVLFISPASISIRLDLIEITL